MGRSGGGGREGTVYLEQVAGVDGEDVHLLCNGPEWRKMREKLEDAREQDGTLEVASWRDWRWLRDIGLHSSGGQATWILRSSRPRGSAPSSIPQLYCRLTCVSPATETRIPLLIDLQNLSASMPGQKTPDLPVELLDIIVDCHRSHTIELQNMSLVSSTWSLLARRRLFHNLTISASAKNRHNHLALKAFLHDKNPPIC
ncbi:hypothetical protein EIP91_010290 [Steccherinum ochraceum]|uniref:F-box domain-containing protein n=1 Tax=Steccherinum ochraceum TaxID=92696 RepID=A0A4R0RQY1_9APHY|nr:hypothetical protein EIP91_010290 [Steccherinum ochraceum]